MKIIIRKSLPSDWQLIQKLNNEVFENDSKNDQYLNLAWPYSKQGIQYYKNVVSSPTYFCFIAEADGEPVGHLVGGLKSIEYRNVKTAEIIELGVSPAYRSKHIGAQLVQAFRDWSKERGFQTIMVNAYYTNEKAIKFYTFLGMKPIDMNLEMQI
ncbi:hypothetical protein A2973_02920 [Candidatus Gottesmanbacteria bacterium RIFCSPLOWO2_01_FULL_49_10]|uniref:N-acetyltransferase domain-containing protein n=1 Tax=Candidatus Gottesmanbacteria bacterium RIFCSPLOWO2_01_FULL_49_10 TaxID=1798396 RepID=A0A1F6B0L6_9BACT|nr:MAG: GCN5-related N-acetyltransferase [Microgenomates group bacterium GW2011_GWA2_47_8]OGG30461.1 MAG: hypothetical protein A2973_02920 [Candidatus Gottesmanbacteria bacterium RIFCSPLOWO2_01_FULL_49_10]